MDDDEEGSAVVADSDFWGASGSEVFLGSSLCLSEWLEPGLDAVVSSILFCESVMFTSAGAVTEPAGLVPDSSEADVPPVLARLCCFCWSLSEGERDRLRFESASGMANVFSLWLIDFFSVSRSLDFSWKLGWEGGYWEEFRRIVRGGRGWGDFGFLKYQTYRAIGSENPYNSTDKMEVKSKGY
jgi:hypothetical protein